MTTAPSVAIATVAALLVYSFAAPFDREGAPSSQQLKSVDYPLAPPSCDDGLDGPVRLRRLLSVILGEQV
jgi:hypothetical protein